MTVPSIPQVIYEAIVRRALAEDLGRVGDLTTDAVVGRDDRAVARIVARAAGRVAGVGPAGLAFRMLDDRCRIEVRADDGADVERGDAILIVDGAARAILTGERTALNFLGHLSGIATLTRTYVEAVAGTGATIVCTRKTTPGLRALEKLAIRCGGGANHRFGLDDAILIKDNHVALAGGVRPAVERARASVGHLVAVELEVDTLDQLEEALSLGVDVVLLDNMNPATLRRAVELVARRCLTEASGGINLETVRAVADSGVDLISVGALTHSAPALDVSLEIG